VKDLIGDAVAMPRPTNFCTPLQPTGDGDYARLSLDRETGQAKLLNRAATAATTGFDKPSIRVVKFLIVANYSSGTVVVLAIAQDRSLKINISWCCCRVSLASTRSSKPVRIRKMSSSIPLATSSSSPIKDEIAFSFFGSMQRPTDADRVRLGQHAPRRRAAPFGVPPKASGNLGGAQ
jgi:hypothetical protein